MADILALIHLAFIAFAVLGGLLVLRWRWVMALHIPAAIWAALVDLAGWPCPLTSWENAALRHAGTAGYSGDFVAHYLFRAIYPAGLTRTMEFAIAAFVILVNATIYAIVIGRSARRRATRAAGRA
ncbi:MAG TPA: DUF2784 domain-containing protein [Thermoanaerobaculia bacterium]|nr:DUF2784 domain-containing protein [Thermoanaerobaculia bacterium]